MRTRIAVVLTGLLALAGLTAPSAVAAGSDMSGSSDLQWASDLPATHGGGSAASHGYLALHARAYARAKAAANGRAGVGGNPSKVTAAARTVSDYPNVSPSFEGIYESGLAPPDTTGAMGPDRYIETINTSFAVYNRSGGQLGSGTLSDLTGVPTGFFGYALSDPQMMWDPTTQRFYYVALYFDSLLLSDNGLAIGWSKTATPTSAADFCQYTLSTGSALADYPKLGDSKDFLIFGWNEFGNSASTYDGSKVAALNKPGPGSTCESPSQFAIHYSGVLTNGDGSMAATPVPANLVDHGAGAGYIVANADLSVTSSADYISVYSITTNGTDSNGLPLPALSGPTTVTVPSYTMPANAPQPGTPYLLDTLDGRFEAAVAAVDPAQGGAMALWTAHAVYGGPGAEERWYEIDPSSGSLLQSGTAGSPSLFTFNGAISPDRADNGSSAAHGGNMAMSVNTSSSGAAPAIQFVTKAGAEAQTPMANLVQSGGANIDFSCSNNAPCRWGDYSGASPDPAAASGDSGRVWLANQWNLAGGSTSTTSWRTWVFGVRPTVTPTTASLGFTTGPQTLVAGTASGPMRVGLSTAQGTDVTVGLGSDSTAGQFATDPAGPWSSTLSMTIAAGATESADFYYRDTRAGSPTLTASATGLSSATQSETVTAAALDSMAVSPTSATVESGSSQVFTASGTDAYGNPVDVSSASWSTTSPDSALSPGSGTSTTFTAGPTAGDFTVTAAIDPVSASADVTVTVTSTAPDAPTNLTAVARGKNIRLSWSGNGATYNVYRSTTRGNEVLYQSGVTGTRFNDKSVTSGQTYFYTVTAVGPGGAESAPSGEASATAR